MEQTDQQKLLAQLLPRISTQLRYAMGNIHFAAAALAPAEQRDQDPALDARAALLDQSYYQMLRLVNNLSLAAWLDQEDPFPLRDQDIVGLAAEVCAQCQSLAELLGLRFSFRCARSSRVCAICPDAMEQLLFQLLSNAFKFTPRGGTVSVELKFTGGRVLLSVSDSGCGIPPALMPTLFAHYRQKEPPTMAPPHGVGLGLLLCRRIAEGHGGTMLAESRPDRGTTVTLSLPDRQLGISRVEDLHFDYAGGFNRALLGLADALPASAFRLREEE